MKPVPVLEECLQAVEDAILNKAMRGGSNYECAHFAREALKALWPEQEVADAFGVSRETLQAEIERMQEGRKEKAARDADDAAAQEALRNAPPPPVLAPVLPEVQAARAQGLSVVAAHIPPAPITETELAVDVTPEKPIQA